MEYRHILFSADEGIARLTLNRPERRLSRRRGGIHGKARTALRRSLKR
jgi:1,4-dihydroxy-2-naphthoyl-CoA synthase